MQQFHYTALDQMSVEKSGFISASSEADAAAKLEQMGLLPIEVSAERLEDKSWLTRDIQFSRTQLTLGQQAHLAKTLSTLFEAKLPVEDVFDLARQSGLPKKAEKFVASIAQRVADGTPLGDAFENSAGVVSPEFASFIRIGDRSNQLPAIMADASTYFSARAQAQSKVMTALIYPAILLIASVILILLLSFTLVPTLTPIFEAANVKIPVAFSVLGWIRETLQTYWIFMVFLTGVLCAFMLLMSQTQFGKLTASRIKYNSPVFGTIARLSQLSIDSRFLKLLLNAGETLNDALLAISHSSSYIQASQLYQKSEQQLQDGGKASEVLSDAGFLPNEFKTFFKLAEDTNRWSEVMESLAQVLEQKATVQRDRVLQLLTPAITVFVGLAIGFLVYTIMGAILQINELSIAS